MRIALIVLLFVVASISQAGIVGKQVEYRSRGVLLKGYIAFDDSVKGKRPGILVVHEWWGNNDYSRRRADMLAGLGYVAMAIDMYGDGKVVETPAEAGKLSGETMSNIVAMKSKFKAAVRFLKRNTFVDPERMGAIGYCFGGGVVLTMACSGEDLKGVVSFHAGLASVPSPKKGAVRAGILVCNGAADKFNPDQVVQKFRAGLDSAKAAYTFINYPDALHSFTNPASTEIGKKFNIPLAYNEKADKQSWADMQDFFRKIFSN